MKTTKSADTLETIAIDGDNKKNDYKTDQKEMVKIKFEQIEDNDHDQNYHTPISFKMNKFMMCFKSEPDLSRVQSGSENEPILNRGRYIAKKLLNGVSMINLRRPLANSNEKAAKSAKTNDVNKMENVSEEPLDVLQNEIQTNNKMPTIEAPTDEVRTIIIDENKIDDDDEDFVDDEEVDREYDDSVDKENCSPIECKTIEYISKIKPPPSTVIGCVPVLSEAIANDSVSPITKSTHRMSKAMQVRKLQIMINIGMALNIHSSLFV